MDSTHATDDGDQVRVVTKAAPTTAASSPTTLATTAHEETFSQRWTSAIDNVRILICRSLQVVSGWSARNPWTTVVSITFFSLAMISIGIFTNFTVETNGDILWPPRGSTTQLYQEWIKTESDFSEERYFSIIYLTVPQPGQNILDRAQHSVGKAFEILDSIRTLPGYAHVCAEPYTNPQTNVTMGCDSYGVFEFWNSSASVFQERANNDAETIAQMSAARFPSGKGVDAARVFGNPTYDKSGSGLLVHNEAYRLDMLFPIWDDVTEFLDEVIDVALAHNDEQYNVQVFTSRSFDDEFQNAIVNDLPLMPMAFIVMTLFCCLVFWKRDKVRSQALLGWGAVWGVFFSILTGYGLLFACGIPLTSATQIVVFVMFGIGLDDAFIISGSYARTDPKKDPVDRIADTINDVGLSIALTTFTSALAFATGCISSINGVYWMCLYAFPTIIIDFFYQITFFVALIVIDGRRMQRSKMDCCVCITVQREDDDQDERDRQHDEVDNQQNEDPAQNSASARFMNAYADILMKPWVKAAVLGFFTALLGACIWGTTQLQQEMDFKDLVPKDSHVISYFETQDLYFTGDVQVSAYFRFVDHADPDVRQQMMDYIDDLVLRNGISEQPPYFWVPDFEAFISSDGTNATTFNEQMDDFLANPLYSALYSNNIIRDPITRDVVNSRVWVFMDVDLSVSKQLIDQLALLEDIAGAQPINEGLAAPDFKFFIHDETQNMWEFYTAVPKELTFTTVVGVVSVSIIAVAFIPHWSAVFFVLPSIVTVYVDLLGALYFMGVRINPVSYITLVMSIGLLVDFIMHILLRYYECQSGSREDRVRETLRTMGFSILVGGISTFLGVMLLAFSTSTIFSTIFRAFIALVVLGCSYGLILLPVVLSLCGPEEGYENPAQETQAALASSPITKSNKIMDDSTQNVHTEYDYPALVEKGLLDDVTDEVSV